MRSLNALDTDEIRAGRWFCSLVHDDLPDLIFKKCTCKKQPGELTSDKPFEEDCRCQLPVFYAASLAAFADSYCDETEIVHTAGVPGADAHNVSTVVSCAHGTGGRDLSSTGGLHSFVMDHLLCSICKARAGLMPALVFLRRTEGERGVCVAQTCTDARSAHKTAHVGTTCPTQRSKWLRRCAFSDLCRSSAVNLPPGGGIGARVLPASRILVPKCYACAFLAQQEKPKV